MTTIFARRTPFQFQRNTSTQDARSRLTPGAFAVAGLLAASLCAGPALADRDRDDERGEAIKLLKTIPIPPSASNTSGKMTGYDISWVDADTQRFYLADRSNAAIQVVDAKTGTYLKAIKAGFAGVKFNAAGAANNGISGPNGVATSGKWLFATDAGSRVVSIDLTTDAIVGDVKTSASPLRADELAYDPDSGTLLVINNQDAPPFATFISVNKTTGALTVGAKIPLDTAHGVNATNGAEQPVWDRRAGKFFLSIPEIGGPGGGGTVGGVARIDRATASVETVYLLNNCQPAGLTLGPRDDLLVGCGVAFNTAGAPWSATGTVTAAPVSIIIDAKDGSIDATIAGVSGSDEVWYNRGDGNYYLAARNNPGGPVMGVINARSMTLTQLVPTINVTGVANVFPAGTAHSLAANPRNNHIFVPLPANNIAPNCLTGCIGVYGAE
jgi:hypothetical protein